MIVKLGYHREKDIYICSSFFLKVESSSFQRLVGWDLPSVHPITEGTQGPFKNRKLLLRYIRLVGWDLPLYRVCACTSRGNLRSQIGNQKNQSLVRKNEAFFLGNFR